MDLRRESSSVADSTTLWLPRSAVLVLGFAFKRSAASLSRLETALAEYQRLVGADGCEPAVIVTGGETQVEEGMEGITEAQFMREHLVAHGVVAEHIRLEENAKYTIQNGLFVRAILESLREEVGAQLRSVVLVTNAFHMPRSKAIFGYILGTAAAGTYIHIASRCLCRCLCVSLCVSLRVSRLLCVLFNE